MADQDILHTTEIMKAALPYIDTGNRGIAELLVKAFDLMGSLKSLKSSENLAACGYTAGKLDIEGLLNGIKPVCSNREKEMIDRILGYFNMKRMFEMYNNIMETMKNMQDFGGFPFGDSDNADDTDNVTGNFGSSNFQSIFEMFKNVNSTDTSADSEPSTNHDSEDSYKGDNSKDDNSKDDIFKEDSENDSDHKGKEEAKQSNSSGSKPNDMMFEMLKTMLPPEQVTTFENLSMLLSTMSYDNNSKPDNKEQNDA